jgi:hypothetical protein
VSIALAFLSAAVAFLLIRWMIVEARVRRLERKNGW